MKALLNATIEICFLRRGPQDLPVSVHLMTLAVLMNLLVGVLMVVDAQLGILRAVVQTLFELALMLGALYAVLRLKGLLPRFTQAATALMLSGFLLGMLALPLVTWGQQSQSAESGLLLLAVFIWGVVVFGHIIRHTFDVSINVGIAAALIYTLFAWNLVAAFFPVPV